METSSRTIVHVYDGLEITGFILNALILATAALFSSRIRRGRTWYPFIGSWLINCACDILIIGRQFDQEPSPAICTAQAILTSSTPIYPAFCALSFCAEVYLRFKNLLVYESIKNAEIRLLVVLPIFVFIASTIINAGFIVHNADSVQRSDLGMACITLVKAPILLSGSLIAIALLLAVGVQGLTFHLLVNKWNEFRTLPRFRDNSKSSLEICVRLAAFTVLSLLGLGVVIAALMNPPSLSASVRTVKAAMPVFSALLFGTQTDMLNLWLFCRRKTRLVRQVDERTTIVI